jgi:hypothetical protein
MIFERHIYRIKSGKMQEAADAMRQEDDAALAADSRGRPRARICTPMFAPQNLIVEYIGASLDEIAEGWAIWRGSGRAPAFFEKWGTLNEEFVASEIWQVPAHHTVEGAENGIAIRWTRTALSFREEALAELLTHWVIEGGRYTARVLRPVYGPGSDVVLEVEYADLADFQVKMAEWRAHPDIDAFDDQWYGLTVPGGSNEVWTLHP